MHKIAHIINPVKVGPASDLFTAQPVTFRSMLTAQRMSANRNIGLYTTQYPEDRGIVPEGFTMLPDLERSVLDVDPRLKGKKLPLIGDVLSRTKDIDCDYVIYTNMDIALMPFFYDTVCNYLDRGHDAVVINRRRLVHTYSRIEELPLMYADLGRSHPGFDCFVIRKALLDRFVLDEICIGISFLEAALVHNIFSFAEDPLFIPDAHLTFHIGMDVLVPRSNDFYRHNRRVFFDRIYPQLRPYFSLRKFPYGALPFPKRAVKWMLNPSLFTRNYLHLENKSFWQKVKTRLDEVRWRILQK